ncbi:group II intron reverse transcriptase/maturase [Bacteroidia bacterium]|nr:group II intron reverse transcriptase/maturase [Bacteroidia bacterium]
MVIHYKKREELLNEEKQMDGVKTKCASSLSCMLHWSDIDWNKCESGVKKLQRRIVKAWQEKEYGKVKSLQYLLTNSFEAKALAVKRVTSNKGGNTSGVDKVRWSTPNSKVKAVQSLKKRGYRPLPFKRVFIEKGNGKKRPLGIPTMKDRAMQSLYLMALEPIAETVADGNSYGFRRKRSTADAVDALHRLLSRSYSPQWILEGDIKGCFDHISHNWLMNNIPIDKSILGKWLKCGVVYNKCLSPTEEGTPQGGIISPTLANMTLDGLEALVKEHYGVKYQKEKKRLYYPKVHLVRYADDFVVTATDRETLENIKGMITIFLEERGLSLSEEKTVITHIDDGFDFLGFNMRKYNGKLLIKPSRKGQKKLTEKLHEVVFRNKAAAQNKLIVKLNPVLTGWGNYYRHVVSKKVFCKMDHILVQQLRRWAFRRHHNKPRDWCMKRYFKTDGNRHWCFKCQAIESGKKKIFTLKLLSDIPIVRHTKVKKDANPFDPKWDNYFEQRQQHAKLKRSYGKVARPVQI